MTARRFALSLTVSLATLLFSTAAAQAVVCDTWYGPGGNSSAAKSGEWGEKENWSLKKVPEASESVCITVPGTYTVSLKPFFGANARVDVGSAESLTLGAGSGSQTLKVVGENWNALGDEENQTSLYVNYDMKIATGGILILDATEGVSEGGKGAPGGGNAFVEEDVLNQPGHPFINEGTIVAESSSTRWTDGMHIHSLANHGSLQATSPLKIESDESSTNTGAITTSLGGTLNMYNFTAFTNEGPVTNSGTFIVNGYPAKGKWIQGSKGSIGGNPVVIESGGGLEESSSSGPGPFTMGAGGAAYLLGTIPKGQTITLADATGQTSLYLGNGTLVNEGTLHIDLPAGDESNTNVEEGSIVNRGTIYGTVEGTKAIDVIDTALRNEPGAVLAADSGTLFSNREITNNGLIEIAPGATFEPVATKLVNGAGGTIAPQISGASTFGKLNLGFRGELEAGGTLAPTLTGGFTPSANEEFDVIEGSPVKGTFGAVSGGFSADYTHESSEPPYVGVIYGQGSAVIKSIVGKTGATANNPTVSTIKSSKGNIVATLSCPAGGASCATANILVTVTEHLKGSKVTAITAVAKSKKKKSKATMKQVVIASSSATLAAGTTKTITLTLNAAGKKLLAKYHKLQVLVTVSAAGKTIRTQKLTITAAKVGRKHK
jgi:hypothetical protein